MSVPDDIALEEGPRGSRWCIDCNSAAAAQCIKDHETMRPQTALRLGLQDVVPRATQALQELPDVAALTALRLLHGQPTTCRLTLGQDDGETFGAEWRVDGQGAEDSLAQTLAVVALAASGRLVQEPIEELQLLNVSSRSLDGPREDKTETLRLVRQRGVRRISGMKCYNDPDWTLDVLRSAAPTLEELHVRSVREAHLDLVHGMPRLQRLDLSVYRGQCPVKLPALPQPSCLKWLRMKELPRATTVSLLRAHAKSLDVLWLRVDRRDDLGALLRQCGLLRLTRLVLWRGCPGQEDSSYCRAQLRAARPVLPRCTMQCLQCDEADYDEF